MKQGYIQEKDEHPAKIENIEEYLAELDEFTGVTAAVDEILDHANVPLYLRQKIESHIHRRKVPGAPYVLLPRHNTIAKDPIRHNELHPLKIHEPVNDNFFP